MAVFAAVKHKEYAQNTDPIILPPGDKSSVTLSNPTVIGNLHLSMKELSQTLRDYGLTGNLSKDTTLTEIRFIPQLNTYGGQQYLEYEVRLIIVDKEPLTTTLRAKPSPPAKPGT